MSDEYYLINSQGYYYRFRVDEKGVLSIHSNLHGVGTTPVFYVDGLNEKTLTELSNFLASAALKVKEFDAAVERCKRN